MASEFTLWKKLDLSRCSSLPKANNGTVSTVLKKYFTAVEELNMAGWRKLSDRGVKVQKIVFLRFKSTVVFPTEIKPDSCSYIKVKAWRLWDVAWE